MAKVETTTKKFKEQGVRISGTETEIHWESTGHLSVRLLDASGHHPLVGRSVTVNVPGEGTISLQTNDDGELFHPDVPYKDYELDLDGVKVFVPAVGNKSEVHERHVAAAPMGFVQGVIYDPHGMLLVEAKFEVRFPSGNVVEVSTDVTGALRCHHVDPGEGEATVRHELGECKATVLASPQKLVRLQLEARR